MRFRLQCLTDRSTFPQFRLLCMIRCFDMVVVGVVVFGFWVEVVVILVVMLFFPAFAADSVCHDWWQPFVIRLKQSS